MKPLTPARSVIPSHGLTALSWPAWGAVLLVITLLGAWLRLYNLTTYPTWSDEHVSLFSACGQIASQGTKFKGRVNQAECGEDITIKLGTGSCFKAREVVQQNTITNIPSATLFWDRGNGLAYSVILHFWILAFGCSDIALRALPCLLGVIAIPFVFAIGLRLTGNPYTGLIAALLVACNALLVQFSQEVRPYSFSIFLSLLSTFLFIGFLIGKDKPHSLKGALYCCSLVVLGFTHYLAIPTIICAHLLGALIASRQLKILVLWGIGVFTLCVIMCLWMLWGGDLGMQAMQEHDQVWMRRATTGIFWWLTPFDWKTGIRLLAERIVQFNMPLFNFWPQQNPINFLLLTAFISSVLLGLIAKMRQSDHAVNAGISIIIALSLGGFLSFYLSWKSGHTVPFIDRYFTFYIPFQALLISTAFSGSLILFAQHLWARYFIILILILGITAMIIPNITKAKDAKEKEKFSFDSYIDNHRQYLSQGLSVKCDSVSSALILGLKIGGEYPTLDIVIDPHASNKVEVNKP